MPRSPLSTGFRSILRRPSVFLIEVAWRWSFGGAAIVLLLSAGSLLLDSVTFTDNDRIAWQSRDFFLISQAALRFLHRLTGRPLVIIAAFVLSTSLLWLVISAIGRALTLKQLVDGEISFRRVLVRHCYRVCLAWASIGAFIAVTAFCSYIALRERTPDYLIYYVLLLPLALIVGIFWSVLNWYLSLGAVCTAIYGTQTTSTGRLTMFFLVGRLGEVTGLTFIFVLFRVAVFLLIFVIAILPARIASGEFSRVWATASGLIYLLTAYFLYVCRMASYISLEDFSQLPGVLIEPVSSKQMSAGNDQA